METLNIALFDSMWRLLEVYKYNNDDRRKLLDACFDPAHTWQTALRGVSPFAYLTSLTIAATSRITGHLMEILLFTPKLQRLTVSCHWLGHDAFFEPKRLHPDFLLCLETITIAGHLEVISSVAKELIPIAEELKSVSLFFGDHSNDAAANDGHVYQLCKAMDE